MERRVPDIARVRSLTGYSPRVTLDEALRLTRDWFVQSGRFAAPVEFREAANF
jgi:nucleoside-diphosphate-sugar epimerase